MPKKIEEILTKVANWFGQNVWLSIVSQGIMMVMPFMIVGSLFSLVNGLPINAWQSFIESSGLNRLLGIPIQFTTNFIAVYITFCVGYQFAQKRGLKKYNTTIGFLSLFAFFVVTPLGDGAIPTTWLGATGMFMGIAIGLLTGAIFKFVVDKNITIKLPESVPTAVSKQFTSMIPSLLIAIVFVIVNWLFSITQWGDAQTALYAIIRTPLSIINGNIWGLFVLNFLACLFWFFGIHGGMVIVPMLLLLFTEPRLQNQAAFAAGEALPNLVTGQSVTTGSMVLPLVAAVLLFSKAKSNRAIASVAIVPSFFGVEEPILFGLPVILNPVMFLPFITVMPVVNILGTYILQITKILPYSTGLQTNVFTPFFINNFLLYGWRGVIAGFVFFVISVAAYYPFVKIYDKQKLAEESVSTDA